MVSDIKSVFGVVNKPLEELIQRLSRERFQGKEVTWEEGHLNSIPVKVAHDAQDNYIMKGDIIYVMRIRGEGDMKCFGCGSDILSARVAHPVWDGPFPCSGDGRVRSEEVPYCPKCEKEPNYYGTPVKK